MVQQLEGKLAAAAAESKEAAKTMQQLQEDFKASHTDRCAALTSAKIFPRPDQTRTTW